MGAILFLVSDSLLAVNKFKEPVPLAIIWCGAPITSASAGLRLGTCRAAANSSNAAPATPIPHRPQRDTRRRHGAGQDLCSVYGSDTAENKNTQATAADGRRNSRCSNGGHRRYPDSCQDRRRRQWYLDAKQKLPAGHPHGYRGFPDRGIHPSMPTRVLRRIGSSA